MKICYDCKGNHAGRLRWRSLVALDGYVPHPPASTKIEHICQSETNYHVTMKNKMMLLYVHVANIISVNLIINSIFILFTISFFMRTKCTSKTQYFITISAKCTPPFSFAWRRCLRSLYIYHNVLNVCKGRKWFQKDHTKIRRSLTSFCVSEPFSNP